MNKKYIKNFDKWNSKKKSINNLEGRPFFNEREIWWCSIGVNIDIEMDGKSDYYERPVLIIKKINNQSAWILPITSTNKENPYIYPLRNNESFVSLSQFRSISSKRLLRKESRISIEEFAHIIIRLKYLLTFFNETTTQ